MKVLVISDLHLGNGDNFGTFGWNETEFLEILEHIRTTFRVKQIVLNGDIFELFKYKFEKVEKNNQAIFDYFRQKNTIYIKGNHDSLCEFGQKSHTIKSKSGKSIHIEHGHNADFMDGTRAGRFVSKLGFDILRLLSRMKFVLNIYFKIVEYDDQIERVPRKYNSYKYLQYAIQLLKNHDVVIFGHTHKIEEHKTYYLNTKKAYINCGSCSMGRFQGVIIDTETLKYETIKIGKKKKGEMLKEIQAIKDSFQDSNQGILDAIVPNEPYNIHREKTISCFNTEK
jgi:predicted phosphodiesterase